MGPPNYNLNFTHVVDITSETINESIHGMIIPEEYREHIARQILYFVKHPRLEDMDECYRSGDVGSIDEIMTDILGSAYLTGVR